MIDKNVVIKRDYLDHSSTLKLYHTRINSRVLRPVSQLIIVHGWASSSNFIELGIKFAQQGIVVHLFDLQGFGYSGGYRRNERMRYFLTDLHRIVQECFADLPLFIYGHSLGALVTLNYLMLNKIRVAGVIFTSPLISLPEFWRVSYLKGIVMDVFGSLVDVCRF